MKTITLDNIKDLQITYDDEIVSNTVIFDSNEWNNIIDANYDASTRITDLEDRISHIEADFFGSNIKDRLDSIEGQDIYSVKHEMDKFRDAMFQVKANCAEFRENIQLLRSQLDALSETQKRKGYLKIFDPISTDLDFPIKIDELDFDYETFVEKLYNL